MILKISKRVNPTPKFLGAGLIYRAYSVILVSLIVVTLILPG
jgi:hypothetical protein